MAKPLALKLGKDAPPEADGEFVGRLDVFKATVETYLPSLAKRIREIGGTGRGISMLQSAFAADFTADEFILLGMAIKYAGMCGVPIHIFCDPDSSEQSEETPDGEELFLIGAIRDRPVASGCFPLEMTKNL